VTVGLVFKVQNTYVVGWCFRGRQDAVDALKRAWLSLFPHSDALTPMNGRLVLALYRPVMSATRRASFTYPARLARLGVSDSTDPQHSSFMIQLSLFSHNDWATSCITEAATWCMRQRQLASCCP
jgi:hypothetical protein